MDGHRDEAPAEIEIDQLDADACRRLLGRGGVGRLALRGSDAPLIRPVNFALWGDALVIRTGEGQIMQAARRKEVAAFEIDGIDPLEHTGWSVVVTGPLCEIAQAASLLDLPLRAWASGTKDQFVALDIDRQSGLRIPAGRGNR